MVDREERIRDKAQQLWEQAGRPSHHPEQHRAEAERLVDAEDVKAGRSPAGPKPKTRDKESGRAVDIGPSPEGDITTVNPGGLPL